MPEFEKFKVRFWIENFKTRQLVKQLLYNQSDFFWNLLQHFRFEEHLLNKLKIWRIFCFQNFTFWTFLACTNVKFCNSWTFKGNLISKQFFFEKLNFQNKYFGKCQTLNQLFPLKTITKILTTCRILNERSSDFQCEILTYFNHTDFSQ